MSCQLSVISKFQDINTVKRFFFNLPSKESTPIRDTEDGLSESTTEEDNWDVAWGFDDQSASSSHTPDAETEEGSSNSRDDHNKWLQECLISLSPTNDVLAIAYESKVCVLAQKWDVKSKGEEIDTRLVPIWETNLQLEEKETITALMCLPLASQKRSTQGGPDWTCIVIGFSSGYIRMYSQTGTLLLSQLLHLERVEKLKCRTYAPPRFLGTSEMHDELLILYTKAIVSIDGFSLIQTLRACRNQVARATASGTDSPLQPPPLAYKKWSLAEQDKVHDFAACGVVCANPFDQLKSASMLGGMKASVKTSPPACSVFMTSGSGPYMGFFYAIEGFAQPILSEVAIAMANKIKSALMSAASGWLGFGGKGKEEKEKPPKIEPATPLPLRFGLPDKRRFGDQILLSPNNNFAATVDSFGRIILIDVHRGVAVRMWKGYRDAQLGWLEVKEETGEAGTTRTSDHVRMAQFLVIYAPRRGILEIWLSAHGPRVAAFNVSKCCRLLCPAYGMVGLNNVTCRGVKARMAQVALVDPDGLIKTCDVPFHLALSDKSSKRARDLHLLKKLKTFLKESSEDRDGLEESIKELLSDFKVSSIAHQAIERILSTKYLPVSVMESVVAGAVDSCMAKGIESLDLDSRIMLKFCKAQQALLSLYAQVSVLNTGHSEGDKHDSADDPAKILTEVLGLPTTEVTSVLRLLLRFDLLTSAPTADRLPSRVTFKEDQQPQVIAATSFLHTFSYRTLLSEEDAGNPDFNGDPAVTTSSASSFPIKQMRVTISKDATEERRLSLGEFLYSGCLRSTCQASELMSVLQCSGIPADQLMNLLLHYWLCDKWNSGVVACDTSGPGTVTGLKSLYLLVKSITAMSDMSEVSANIHSPWWTRVRNLCSQSTNCRAAYLAVLVCKAVAAHYGMASSKEKDPDADSASVTSDDDMHERKPTSVEPSVTCSEPSVSLDCGWESLTVDMESWEVLLKQSEDILSLTTLLHTHTASSQADRLSHSIQVSVSRLLLGGKGSVPEVIGRYCVQESLQPESLFYNYPGGHADTSDTPEELEQKPSKMTEGMNEEQDIEGEKEKMRNMIQSDKVKYQLTELRHRFPHSLHNDVLLANCCWEYAVAWNKSPETIKLLHISLEFLRVVQNARFRQGLSSLLWHMFVQKKASASAHLMEKVGKTPKDRLCRKEVSMSDSALTTFVSLCCDLMQITMDANCESHEVPVTNTEPAWACVSGPASLLELCVDQKLTNYGLLRLHLHVLTVMAAVLHLGLRAKVLSLFDNKGRTAVFKELHSHPLLPTQKVDDDLYINRQNFLCKVMSAAVASIPPPPDHSPGASASVTSSNVSACKRQRSQFPEAFKWPQEALSLGKDFGHDLDTLKRHHASQLYAYGHDKLAEEIMASVTDQQEMGIQLMNIAGCRLAYEIFQREPDKNFEYLAGMSTALTLWLKNLDLSSLHFPHTSLSSTGVLAEAATHRLLEHPHHSLAQELYEKSQMMADLQDKH